MNPRSDCPLHAKPRASRLVDAFSRISTFQSRSRTVSACVRLSRCGRVAQLVEQRPFKAWVAGSNPAALTMHSCRCAPTRRGASHFRRVLCSPDQRLGALVGLAAGFPTFAFLIRTEFTWITPRCHSSLTWRGPGARVCDAPDQETRRAFPKPPENGQCWLPRQIRI